MYNADLNGIVFPDTLFTKLCLCDVFIRPAIEPGAGLAWRLDPGPGLGGGGGLLGPGPGPDFPGRLVSSSTLDAVHINSVCFTRSSLHLLR